MHFLHIAFALQFTFFEYMINMPRNDGLVTLEQFNHLLLQKPHGLVLHHDLDARFPIFRLIKNKLATRFSVHCDFPPLVPTFVFFHMNITF